HADAGADAHRRADSGRECRRAARGAAARARRADAGRRLRHRHDRARQPRCRRRTGA
ncbi:hypothetical protein LTR94_032906, partial [Friedmanniomyces endolithicus]